MNYTIAVFNPPGHTTTYSYHATRLLEAGLVELGHDVHVVEGDLEAGRRNIIINAHKLHGHMAKDIAKHDCVVLQTEMLTGGWLSKEQFEGHYLPILGEASWVWEWVDMRNVADLGTWGIERVPMLLPGQHPWLCEIRRREHPDLDVVFMGSLTDRRIELIDSLAAIGLDCTIIGASVGRPQRNNLLARAKVMLCPTDDNLLYFTSARVAYAANNGIPCVIERPLHCPWPGSGCVVKREEVVEACYTVCEAPRFAKALVQQAQDEVPYFTDNLRAVIG